MFKRGVLVVLVASMMAMASAKTFEIETNLKNPVVKDVREVNGKIQVILKEGAEGEVTESGTYEFTVDSGEAVATPVDGESATKSYKAHKKGVTLKEVEAVPTPVEGEETSKAQKKGVVLKEIKDYPHGSVEISSQKAVSAKSTTSDKVVQKSVELAKGESLELEYRGHHLKFTAIEDDVLELKADDKEPVKLPKANVVDLEIEGAVIESADLAKPKLAAKSATSPLVLKEVNGDMSTAAQKFTELATQMTGGVVSKEAAPIVFVCGLVGALAAIIGVAAIAIGRRHDAAAEDPASVLADSEVEDVEAGVQKKDDDEKEEDAPAEKSDSLSDSESDSEAEEGTFANDKEEASV